MKSVLILLAAVLVAAVACDAPRTGEDVPLAPAASSASRATAPPVGTSGSAGP